jgi:hypothetical protein
MQLFLVESYSGSVILRLGAGLNDCVLASLSLAVTVLVCDSVGIQKFRLLLKAVCKVNQNSDNQEISKITCRLVVCSLLSRLNSFSSYFFRARFTSLIPVSHSTRPR